MVMFDQIHFLLSHQLSRNLIHKVIHRRNGQTVSNLSAF
jgi:hypothetical protein